MLELPDAERFRRAAAQAAEGRRIADVEVLDRGILRGASPGGLSALLTRRRVLGAERHGKCVFLSLDDGHVLALEPGPRGRLQLEEDEALPRPNTRLMLRIEGARRLDYVDSGPAGAVTLARARSRYTWRTNGWVPTRLRSRKGALSTASPAGEAR